MGGPRLGKVESSFTGLGVETRPVSPQSLLCVGLPTFSSVRRHTVHCTRSGMDHDGVGVTGKWEG